MVKLVEIKLASLSDPIYVPLWLAIVAGLPQLVSIILNFIVAMHIKSTREAISLLEKNTNSIKDDLVKITGESEKAKGIIEGKALAVEEKKNERT